MRLYGDLDRLRPALVAWHAHIPVHEPDEVLHGVQNGLNLQLNGWSPRLDESLSLNCRLIQLTGDQLFFCNVLVDCRLRVLIVGRTEAPPAIPALETALGSHSCGPLSSAQV